MILRFLFIRLFLTLAPAFLGMSAQAEVALREASGVYVLKGLKLPESLRISSLQAWSFLSETWVQVKLQIDERTDRGDFVLERGLPFTAAGGNDRLDERDELSFFAKDLGDCLPSRKGVDQLKSTNPGFWRIEVEETEATLGPQRKCLFLTTAPVKVDEKFDSRSELSFDARLGQIQSPYYRYHFREEKAALLGQLSLREESGGAFREIISWSRFKMIFKAPWWFTDLLLTEDDLFSEIESWRQGPVRTIVAVGVKFKGLLSLFNLHMFSELVFYGKHLTIPTVMEFPIDVGSYFSPGSGLYYEIGFAQPGSWHLKSTNLRPIPKAEVENFVSPVKSALGSRQFDAEFKGSGQSFKLSIDVDTLGIPDPFILTKAIKISRSSSPTGHG